VLLGGRTDGFEAFTVRAADAGLAVVGTTSTPRGLLVELHPT
jgi:hypothetical protein